MANPNPTTTRWLAAILHQLSASVEQWRLLADSKAVEIENLKVQLRALQEMVETQKKVIIALEQELAPQTSQDPAAPDLSQVPTDQTVAPNTPPGPTEGFPSTSQPYASISLPQVVVSEPDQPDTRGDLGKRPLKRRWNED